MQIIKNYQNKVYTMALSLTGNPEKSKKAAIKAFESVLKTYHTDDLDSVETRNSLYKSLLKNICFFSINKKDLDKKGILNSIKYKLGLFDKKVFVLKYEFGCSLSDIVYILNSNAGKVKKSLLKSAQKMAKVLEDDENEM